jgi:hypothetical protein
MKTRFLALSIILCCILSCKNQSSDNTGTENNVSEVAAKAGDEAPKGKYAIKSGIVVYKTQMMGMEVKQTLSFDDYGKKEVTDVMMEMMGTKIHTVSLTKDGFIYNIDMVKKTGTKSPEVSANNTNIDFQNLTEEMTKEMNLKKEGNEMFLGKNCEKMSIDYTKMKMKGTFLVYRGVALKVDTDLGTMKMKLEAEQFEENPTIPAEKFEIPADITITGN